MMLSVDWAESTTMTISWYRLLYSSGCFFPLYFLSKGRIATDQLVLPDIFAVIYKIARLFQRWGQKNRPKQAALAASLGPLERPAIIGSRDFVPGRFSRLHFPPGSRSAGWQNIRWSPS